MKFHGFIPSVIKHAVNSIRRYNARVGNIQKRPLPVLHGMIISSPALKHPDETREGLLKIRITLQIHYFHLALSILAHHAEFCIFSSIRAFLNIIHFVISLSVTILFG